MIRYLCHRHILDAVDQVALRIEEDYRDVDLHLICVLNGAVHFFTDLVQRIPFDVTYHFLKVSSYEGTDSKQIQVQLDLLPTLKDKHVIVVEDIIDNGQTFDWIRDRLEQIGVASYEFCTLLHKGNREVKYVAVPIPVSDQTFYFIGYGLDCDQIGRNRQDIFIV